MKLSISHLAVLVLMAFITMPAMSYADSSVYIFIPPMDSRTTTTLTVNGIDAGDFTTPVMQHYDSNEETVKKLQKKHPNLQIPIIKASDILYPAVKKCVLKTEGPTVLLLEATGIDPVLEKSYSSKIETTLDVEDGKVYYYKIEMPQLGSSGTLYQNNSNIKNANKLANEVNNVADVKNGEIPMLQLMPLSEKEGQKWLKDKKFHSVLEYNEE